MDLQDAWNRKQEYQGVDMIAIINYGLGNLGSIANMLKAIGEQSVVTDKETDIRSADKLILPGVGSFDAGMSRLEETGLKKVLIQQALEEGKPILGICLEMQLLGRMSEEGSQPGLGLIPFDNVRFRFEKDSNLKVPHMGWDIVEIKQKNPLTDNLKGRQRYYFVHSYYAKCDRREHVLMTCDYGNEFAAAVGKENIMGVQFHPEKSHDFGMSLLENFVKRC